MKAKAAGLLTGLFVFGMVAVAQASLTTVGTATYGGNDYNLIYEDDSINGGLVWLDYTPSVAFWWIQKDWAEGVGVGGSLTVNLDPGYTIGARDGDCR